MQAHEWSNGDISPEITFTADDGRKFGKKFSMNLKVNTAPILEYAGIGKTTESGEDYYVLIFQAKDMGTMIGTQHVHKDINIMNVTAGGVSRPPITLSVTGSDFATGGDLLAAVSQLDIDHPLPTGNGLLRLKTDVKVGGPETEYSVSIKDSQGLSSAVISAKTKKNKLSDVQLFDGFTPIPDPADSTSAGATDGNPKVFAGMSGKILTAKAAPDGARITGKVEKQNSDGTWTETDTVSGTTPVTVNLPALAAGENEALYKISLKAQLSGYDDSDSKDFYITLVRQEVPVLKLKQNFSQSDDTSLYCISAGTQAYVKEDIIPDAAQYNDPLSPLVIYNMGNGQCKLELSASAGTAVKYKLDSTSSTTATATATIKVISGAHTLEVWAERGGIPGPRTTVHIEVVNAVSSYGELKNVVQNAPAGNEIMIKIKNRLVAMSGNSEIAVSGGKKLTLTHIEGIPSVPIDASAWGRIFKISGNGTVLNLKDIKLEGGKADIGGAAYVEDGGILKLTGRTLIILSSGFFSNTPGENDVYLADGTSIKLDSALTATNPIVAPITPQIYDESTQVLTGSKVNTEYAKFSVTQQDDGFLWTIKDDGTLQKISAVISGSDTLAWQKLKDAVQNLPEGSTITINGEIKATNDPGNSGEIVIDKNLTIKGKTGATSDILDANSNYIGTPPAGAPTTKHRIFKVQSGKRLTLENMTLKNGHAAGYSEDGCGGAIYTKGGIVTMTNCTVAGNRARIGGAVYAESDGSTPAIVKVSGGTIGGEPSNTQNLSYLGGGGKGGGVYIKGTGSSLTLSDNASITGNRASNGKGGGVYVGSGATFMLESGTITNCTGNQKSGAGVYVESGAAFKMKGSSCVTPTADDNDVYLDGGSKIELVGSLTSTAPVARITVADSQYSISTQVLTAGSGVALAKETYKFTVTPKIEGGTPQPWTVGGNGYLKPGRYTEVPYGQLETYLANASETEVNYIEVTGPIPADDLKGTAGASPSPGTLGQLLKSNAYKKVALKLPSGLSVPNMDHCFAKCENLVSVENLPSDVMSMQACFSGCVNLTTGPDIPATVTHMRECFWGCTRLQSVKINCPYNTTTYAFYRAFTNCTALENGGIKVPSLYLAIYKVNAGTMGTTEAKFSAQ